MSSEIYVDLCSEDLVAKEIAMALDSGVCLAQTTESLKDLPPLTGVRFVSGMVERYVLYLWLI